MRRPPVDDNEVVADTLDLAEEVGRHEDRHAELVADTADEGEHLVATVGVEAVGRLVQDEQAWVVDERLRELDPLLHAGGVGADRAITLLEEADVPQDLRRPVAGAGAGQAADPRHVENEVGGADIHRQAIVLRHVADVPP